MKPIKTTTRKNWTPEDNKELVHLYMLMLDLQTEGTKFVKSRHVKSLAEHQGRTKGSIECKLMNVSCIAQELGLGFVKGYKPLKNYQQDLKTAVLDFIKNKDTVMALS